MKELVERIKGQLKYCDACENEVHQHATATRIAEMLIYHYIIVDKPEDESDV